MELSQTSLRDLHQLHSRIHSLQARIEKAPKQIAARKAALERQAAALESVLEELKGIKVQTHEKELRTKSLESRVEGLQLKINSAKSNKEYTMLVAERDADKAAQGVLEDEILECLERQDEKSKQIDQLQQEHAKLESEFADFEREATEHQREHRQSLAGSQEKLVEAEQTLPGDVQEAYNRLVKSRGPDALCSVQGTTCTGCYTSITPQMYNELLASSLVLCKSCGRILYLEE